MSEASSADNEDCKAKKFPVEIIRIPREIRQRLLDSDYAFGRISKEEWSLLFDAISAESVPLRNVKPWKR